jgi:ABC-type uncharacterized transport system permease subunit
MNDSNLKPQMPNWKLILGVVVGGLVAIWLVGQILSALAGLIKLGIVIAVIAVVAGFVLKLVNKPKK